MVEDIFMTIYFIPKTEIEIVESHFLTEFYASERGQIIFQLLKQDSISSKDFASYVNDAFIEGFRKGVYAKNRNVLG